MPASSACNKDTERQTAVADAKIVAETITRSCVEGTKDKRDSSGQRHHSIGRHHDSNSQDLSSKEGSDRTQAARLILMSLMLVRVH